MAALAAAQRPPALFPQHSSRLPRSQACQRQQLGIRRRRRSQATRAKAKPEDEVEPVPPAMLPRLESDDEREAEAAWVAGMVTCWLDEEWPAQELVAVHAGVGEAAGRAYARLRQQGGAHEVGDLVLGMASELMGVDFHPTFTSPFEVANKVAELLMLRGGCDVCCTSEADRTAISRFEARLAAAESEAP